MEHCMMIAHIFAPFLMIMGIWMLFYHGNLVKIGASIKATPGCFHIMNVVQLLIGLLLIKTCNVWEMSSVFFVTLIGWVFVIRSLLGLFFPQFFLKKLHKGAWVRFMGIIPLVWGFFLYWYFM